jgi:PAS domain S-box-containing protein
MRRGRDVSPSTVYNRVMGGTASSDAEAERALRERELRFRQIVESIPQVFYLSDPKGRMVYVSPAFRTLWGYDVERLYGDAGAWIALVHPEDRQRVLDTIAQNRGRGQYEVEYRFLRADGAVRWVSSRSTEIYDTDGALDRIVGIATDITQRRELEEQLRQAQKMEAVGQLAGGIAHDFNNLLTVIVANAGLLRDDPAGDDTSTQIAEIEHAARRAAELTKKLLGFSRQAVLTLQPTSLGDVAREVSSILRHAVDPRVEVRLACAESGDISLADPTEMSHVVMNLCLNARDAMPGGGRLTLETGRAVVDAAHAARVPGGKAGDFVYLSVVDTGAGIPPDILPRIFEPFFTTKPVGQGTGLGLAVAFGIVKQHQGFIECGTSPEVGTRFTIFLPHHEGGSAERSATERARAADVRGGTETILLVDDEDGIRNVGRRILEKCGYRVLVAIDGAEAVAVYERYVATIDLVIVDLTMPRLTGTEVIQRIRTLRPDARIIVSTGNIGEQARSAEQAGSFRVLDKPYTPDALMRIVRQALDDRR